jgi:hypothetical protein
MTYCADLTFGLSPQSLAILHLLAQRETEFATLEKGRYKLCIRTTPWYNGIERGVALQVFRDWNPSGPCRVIVFGERREDDQIFIEHWDQQEPPFNAPTISQRDVEMWSESEKEYAEVPREIFSREETYQAADRVYELMREFYLYEEPPKGELHHLPARLRVV